MQASPAADHVGSMNARLIFRQEAVNHAGAAQPRMPEFDTWVLLRKSVGEISCFSQRERALPVHHSLFSSRRQEQLDSLASRQGIEFGQDALDIHLRMAVVAHPQNNQYAENHFHHTSHFSEH